MMVSAEITALHKYTGQNGRSTLTQSCHLSLKAVNLWINLGIVVIKGRRPNYCRLSHPVNLGGQSVRVEEVAEH